MLNKSFEDGWENIYAGNGLTNQQPSGWLIDWVEIGDPLYASSADKANGVPEMVHKQADQLPPDEQPGQPGELILDGNNVYKIFHAQASFGATLSQVVIGLKPNTTGTIKVPVNVHYHGATDPWGVEVGVFVNDGGQWFNTTLKDKEWNYLDVSFDVDNRGEAHVEIYVKSKWNSPKDFFIDDISFDAIPTDGPPPGDNTLTITIPDWAKTITF